MSNNSKKTNKIKKQQKTIKKSIGLSPKTKNIENIENIEIDKMKITPFVRRFDSSLCNQDQNPLLDILRDIQLILFPNPQNV